MVEANKVKEYFSWSDAWVFTSLYYTHKELSLLDLTKIISAGDVLNHAIFTNEELKSAFTKFIVRGIIEFDDNNVQFTPLGKVIVEKTEKVKGGLFSRVDISLKKINSFNSKLPLLEDIKVIDTVLADDAFHKAYGLYRNQIGY